MTDDQARALLIVAALWTGATNSASFVGGRMTAPVPPAEVRYVTIEVPVAVPSPIAPPAAAEVPPLDPPAAPVAAEPEPAPEVEAAPVPKPRPKIEVKPKAQPKARPSALKKSLPSCDVVKREFDRMSWPERMAAYARASAEEKAHGKQCLGM